MVPTEVSTLPRSGSNHICVIMRYHRIISATIYQAQKPSDNSLPVHIRDLHENAINWRNQKGTGFVTNNAQNVFIGDFKEHWQQISIFLC